MSTLSTSRGRGAAAPSRRRRLSLPPREVRRPGLQLVGLMIALLWVIEVINTLDSNRLDSDGIYGRSFDRLWGILTSPLIHASFAHLLSNTIPLAFTGVIIALRGARRVAAVTALVVLVGGLGTWLIGPAHASTIGASGVVFGYSAYLIARGVFSRRLVELITGAVVAVVLGGALMTSLLPRYGVSWQAHLCGGLAGLLAAWLMGDRRRRSLAPARRAAG
jgi:membrane associated rhomboid family serine protease